MYSYWNDKRLDEAEALAYEGRPVSAVLGWGGVKIFDDETDLLALCAEYARAMQHYSCGQCIPCRSGSAVIKELFDGLKDGSGSESDLDRIASLSSTISKTSMCQIGQSTPSAFTHIIENFRDRLVSSIGKGAKGPKETKGAAKGETRSILTAPCMQACPIHLDIPAYVEAIAKGRFEESLDIIRQRLPLPGVLGRICVRPCEFYCRRGVLDEPIQIKHLKRFVADFEITRGNSPALGTLDTPDREAQQEDAKKVAIVGAGPAGLTAAHFLVKNGYDVTVFEMLPEPGGMAAVGIPDYRLPREIITREVGFLEQMGVKFVYNRAFGTSFVLEDLEEDGFKAVFVGMGCHCHKSMGVEGEDKGYDGFVPGVYFLRNVNLGLMDEVPTGRKMVVVGGGNVAIDCVRTAFRVGFDESHLVYRRSRTEMPADDVEINDAEEEGVQYHFLTAPKRIIAKDGKVTGLECLRMELGEPDESGRRRPVPIEGSEFIIEADVIVPAIGQEGDISCICNIPGVDITKWGTIIVDDNFMTSRAGVFSGGDCVIGPDVLIRACAHGRMSALKIHTYLTGGSLELLEEQSDEFFLDKLDPFDPQEKLGIPGGTHREPIKHEAPFERRVDNREVEKGFTHEEAVGEASRCLRCYRIVTYAYGEHGPDDPNG